MRFWFVGSSAVANWYPNAGSSFVVGFPGDGSNQVAEMGFEEFIGLFIGLLNFGWASRHDGRIGNCPIESDRFGRRLGEGAVPLLREGDDDLIVIEIRNLV